jgi:transcriptional regulator with XRE-family HTH domain
VRKAPSRAGVTQTELADHLGVTQAMVSYLEHGRRCPSTAVARGLMALLDLDELTLRLLEVAAVPGVGRCLGSDPREREKAWRVIHRRGRENPNSAGSGYMLAVASRCWTTVPTFPTLALASGRREQRRRLTGNARRPSREHR